MNLAFATDLHLERVTEYRRRAFYRSLSDSDFDALVITGDISVARWLPIHLRCIAEACQPRPVYFVLGNHDFYGSSFEAVDRAVADVCAQHSNLHHLGGGEIVPLTADSALIGHRGWADARAGFGIETFVRSPDRHHIRDFQGQSHSGVLQKMESLGKASGRYFQAILPKALSQYRQVWIATHVPPFYQAAFFNGRTCAWSKQPHFMNSSAGGVILKLAKCYPSKNVMVMSGHTHSPLAVKVANNVEIRVGRSSPRHPMLSSAFSISGPLNRRI